MKTKLCLSLLSVGLLGSILTASASATLAYSGLMPDDSTRVWVADDTGMNAHKIAKGGIPVVSPDGTKIAFAKETSEQTDLYLADVASGSTKRLLKNIYVALDRPDADYRIVWSPTSSMVAVIAASGKYESGELKTVDVATNRVVTIKKGLADGPDTQAFSFSPDGNELIFDSPKYSARCATAIYDIWKENLSNGVRTRLTTGGQGEMPLWGPNKIVYTRYSDDCNAFPRRGQLWTMNADGTSQTQLTRYKFNRSADGPFLQAVGWDQTGSRLVANFNDYQYDPGRNRALAVDPATGNVVDLLPGYRENTYTDGISRDGQRVLVAYEKPNQNQREETCNELYDELLNQHSDSAKNKINRKIKILNCPTEAELWVSYLGLYTVGYVLYNAPDQVTPLATSADTPFWNQ